ncbi:MAG: TIGR01777 family oxidoreductase [Bacteroidia bacterium]|nr:TIGR01777 family oxidoreductase [Bacteroidia bacterium]NNF30307.1 TIGR01777 family protein [Flavobacteriaceae bacterium]MBT8276383.1 TIGR01777 family oxidoreductase [Bacteroidia bacterium]NNJ80982.1 TIGR01777 family protein [Flavobacteriaceae bacterium]NNK53548.1 TIGR01777 family protein [Flavobacteriaceae bacterium]
MNILITGATGVIGTHLVKACLSKGHRIHFLTTRKEKIESKTNYKGFYWNPDTGEVDNQAFKDVTVIIHLAGASISKRWTKSYKKVILDSRIKTAKLLFTAMQNNEHSVTHFVSASGVSIYPPSFTKFYTEEDNEVDNSFLGEVVKAWEDAANQFKQLGIKVTKVRTGLVLATEGGALPAIAAPVRKGVGAPLGSGNQWQSWIHIDDMTNIYLNIIENGWGGTINAVSPNPATNKRLTKLIAKTLKKPLWLPNVPAFVLKLLLGEMSMLVLQGQLVSSKRLEEAGFSFRFFNLESALDDLLKD